MKYKLLGNNDYTFDLIGEIGRNRGVEDVKSLLTVTKDSCLSPFLLKNMEQAIALVEKHLKKQSRVHIIVDSDADGLTSATILYNYLTDVGFENISWNNHPKKYHGIIESELKGFDFDFLIVPDAGSNDFEQHKLLKEKGIDILILDHHEAEYESEDALVVNPKLCDYPNKEISGAVVVHKFCEAYDLQHGLPFSRNYLDLVSIGVIGDMMDSRVSETRYYCTEGLKDINNLMLKALIEKQKFKMGDNLTIIGIQFYVAPLINSVFRSGTIEELDKMFEAFITREDRFVDYQKRNGNVVQVSFQEDTAREIVNIKARQDRTKKKLLEELLPLAEQQDEDKIMIINMSSIEDPEMLGVLANELANKKQRPILLVRTTKDGMLSGSGRNYSRFEIPELKSFLNDFGFEKLAGHENAFGVSLLPENEVSIKEKLKEATKDITIEQMFFIDFEIPSSDFNKGFVIKINNLKELWAEKFNEPYVLIKDVQASEPEVNEKSTMLSWTERGIKYVLFNPSEKQKEQLLDKSVNCDIIGRVSVNEWKGELTYQVIISDFEVKGEAKQTFWF